jgi:ABC-type antimicrobial peptide transport system permease subunit
VALVVTGFALLALLLTVVGVYGTLAYAVSQRRRELGVRLAMGATGGAVLRAVLFRSTRTVAAGILIGVLASLLATRLLESQLFGVTSTDPLTVGLAIAVVLGAAMAASFVPARRAAGVDPMISLRLE